MQPQAELENIEEELQDLYEDLEENIARVDSIMVDPQMNPTDLKTTLEDLAQERRIIQEDINKSKLSLRITEKEFNFYAFLFNEVGRNAFHGNEEALSPYYPMILKEYINTSEHYTYLQRKAALDAVLEEIGL